MSNIVLRFSELDLIPLAASGKAKVNVFVDAFVNVIVEGNAVVLPIGIPGYVGRDFGTSIARRQASKGGAITRAPKVPGAKDAFPVGEPSLKVIAK